MHASHLVSMRATTEEHAYSHGASRFLVVIKLETHAVMDFVILQGDVVLIDVVPSSIQEPVSVANTR